MKKDKDYLEKEIEGKVCDYAKGKGFLCYKFTSPARRSVPDRIFITPEGKVFFIEFKRLGAVSTAAQEVEQQKIRNQGITVYVVDRVAEGRAFVDVEAQRPPKASDYISVDDLWC